MFILPLQAHFYYYFLKDVIAAPRAGATDSPVDRAAPLEKRLLIEYQKQQISEATKKGLSSQNKFTI